MKQDLYYYADSVMDYQYIRAPKLIYSSKKLKKLSSTAKVLYIKLFDLLSLSIKNKWKDENNRVYVNYTVKNAMDDLGCCYEKIIKTFSELDVKGGAGLIERKRIAYGKPLAIYILNPEVVCNESNKENKKRVNENESDNLNNEAKALDNSNICDTDISGTDICTKDKYEPYSIGNKNKTNDVCTSHSYNVCTTDINNNNIYKNNINNIYFNKINTDLTKSYATKRKENRDVFKWIIKEKIDYNNLINEIPEEKANKILNVILDNLCSDNVVFEADGDILTYEVWQKRLMSLTKENILYVYNYITKNDFPENEINKRIAAMLHRSLERLNNKINDNSSE